MIAFIIDYKLHFKYHFYTVNTIILKPNTFSLFLMKKHLKKKVFMIIKQICSHPMLDISRVYRIKSWPLHKGFTLGKKNRELGAK